MSKGRLLMTEKSTARESYGARDMAELGVLKRQLFCGDEISESVRSYRPRASDVVIASFANCGTTWLQQMFHALRTRGDMSFEEISTVVPWIETAVSLSLDLDAPQCAEPRGFKSHLSYPEIPKGSRYVISVRDPKDVLISSYRFNEGWFFEPGAISITDFFGAWLQGAK